MANTLTIISQYNSPCHLSEQPPKDWPFCPFSRCQKKRVGTRRIRNVVFSKAFWSIFLDSTAGRYSGQTFEDGTPVGE